MTVPDILEIRIDEAGVVDPAGEAALKAALDGDQPTDLMVFSHGWNNTPGKARELYGAFFERLESVVGSHGVADRKLVYLGVFWPSIRWSDEPIPAFSPGAVVDLGSNAGPGAGLEELPVFDPPPPPDAETAALIAESFPPEVRNQAAELLALIGARPDDEEALERARELVREIAQATAPDNDQLTETPGGGVAPAVDTPQAAEADDAPFELFDTFSGLLEELNIDTGEQGGAAGLKESLGRLWHGVQEVARGLTYWQMKSRAGVVGETGLGPLVGRLKARYPDMSINLIGHSFGARVVSFALKGIDVPPGTTPVQSVTLLQGAFSHFAFAGTVAEVPGRSGALAGQQAKVAGPVTACFSKFDSAVGTLYPWATMAKGDALAGLDDMLFKFGGVGFDGHQRGVAPIVLQDSGAPYDFTGKELVNVDAQRKVRNGKPPSGAHSDIVHDELAWVVVSAAGLARTD